MLLPERHRVGHRAEEPRSVRSAASRQFEVCRPGSSGPRTGRTRKWTSEGWTRPRSVGPVIVTAGEPAHQAPVGVPGCRFRRLPGRQVPTPKNGRFGRPSQVSDCGRRFKTSRIDEDVWPHLYHQENPKRFVIAGQLFSGSFDKEKPLMTSPGAWITRSFRASETRDRQGQLFVSG